MEDSEEDEVTYSLFDTIARGRAKSELILPDCMLLLGRTRAGKSTLFNWINGKPLIGRKDKFISKKVYYYPVDQSDKSVAELSDGQTSKTLIPNVHNMEGLSRIDSAGFSDKRNYVGVFGVDCMLNFIFEKGQRFSFILVMDEEQLSDTAQRVFQTIRGFANLFDYENLDADTKSSLINSVSIIITKADSELQDDGILNSFQKIIKNCSKSNYKVVKKEICIQILADIVKKQRIGFFRKDQQNCHAPQCTVLQILRIRGWGAFDLQNAKVKYPEIIVNSFKQEYQKFQNTDQQTFLGDVERKIGSYRKVAQIFKKFLEKSIQNIAKPTLDFAQVFASMKQFINTYDEYNVEDKDINQRIKYNSTTFQNNGIKQTNIKQAINTMIKFRGILKCFQTVQLINTKISLANSQSQIQIFCKQYCCLSLSMFHQLYFPNSTEKTIIINFGYLVLRGFDELQVVNQIIKKFRGNPLNQIQSLLLLFQKNFDQIKLRILEIISNRIRNKKLGIFSTIDQLGEYISFIQSFIEQRKNSIRLLNIDLEILSKDDCPRNQTNKTHGQQQKNKIIKEHDHENQVTSKTIKVKQFNQQLKFLITKKISQQMLYYQLLLSNSNKKGKIVLADITKMLDDLLEQRQIILDNMERTKETPDSLREIDEMQNYFLSFIKVLGKILAKKKKYGLAIKVFSVIGDASSVCQCYEFQVQKQFKESPKMEDEDNPKVQEGTFIEYAEYCATHGRLQKAIIILQDCLRLVEDDAPKRQRIKEAIVRHIANREQSYTEYIEEFKKCSKFLFMEINNLVKLMNEIKIEPDLDLLESLSQNGAGP